MQHLGIIPIIPTPCNGCKSRLYCLYKERKVATLIHACLSFMKTLNKPRVEANVLNIIDIHYVWSTARPIVLTDKLIHSFEMYENIFPQNKI